jgi:hypothetical protein
MPKRSRVLVAGKHFIAALPDVAGVTPMIFRLMYWRK